MAVFTTSNRTTVTLEKRLCTVDDLMVEGTWRKLVAKDPLVPSCPDSVCWHNITHEKRMLYELKNCRLSWSKKRTLPGRVRIVGDSLSLHHFYSMQCFIQSNSSCTALGRSLVRPDALRENLRVAGFNETTISSLIKHLVAVGKHITSNGWIFFPDCQLSHIRLNGLPADEKLLAPLLQVLTSFHGDPLGPSDFIVLNVGLHGGLVSKIHLLLALLRVWGSMGKKEDRPTLVFRQTTPQHWASKFGTWSEQAMANMESCASVRPLQDDKISKLFEQARRDTNTHELGSLMFFPVAQYMKDRSDEHTLRAIGLNHNAINDAIRRGAAAVAELKPDCTHYCISSSVWRTVNGAFLVFLDSLHDVRTWGTRGS